MKLTASSDHLSSCFRAWQSGEIGENAMTAEASS
jgi:hypothetical protein